MNFPPEFPVIGGGSYERMVPPCGEKFSKLSGGINKKELADIAPMDATLRLPPT
ncbi:MAG: hypothetical protein ABI042_09815 [Verrucomicrobiota bacterium]